VAGESRELLWLLESGGFTGSPDSLIVEAVKQKPHVVKFGDDSPYTWNALPVTGARPAPIYFYVLRKDPIALVVPRQGEDILYMLPAFTKVWNVYRPQRLDVVWDEDTKSFLGTLVLSEPAVSIKVDVLTPYHVHPSSIPVLSMVTAEVDVLPPVSKELEEKFKKAEREGSANEMFANLIKSHKPEEFIDKYIEYTGWRNQYVFIGHVKRVKEDINPFTGSKYLHASVDIGALTLDMMISPRWGVREGDRVKGIGLLEMWLEG